MARKNRYKDAADKREGGGFVALPHAVIRSHSYSLLSAHAIKLLFDQLAQYNGGNNGDLSQAEAMLINQAQSLQAIFTNFAERAQNQTGVAQIQTMLGLALKAQSQCRATLQTLVDVKYPRQATFIKQANIANQQQVNNGTSPPGELPSRKEKTIQSNELLEAQHGKRMDTGKTGAASGADSQLETVGAIHRA